jgi:hypothetical protein
MNFKDDPNYVTTKEVSDALRVGRTSVQKLEALGKLTRAGVEGNRVYYSRPDMDALADDKTYGTEQTTKSGELPPPYYADGYSPDAEYRKWERAMMQRFEAPRQPVQPDTTTGIERHLERIGNELTEVREQRELRQREQEQTSQRGVSWSAAFGIVVAGAVVWVCAAALRNQKEAAQAERDREFELKWKLLLQNGAAADLEEYVALRWKMENPGGPAWEAVPSFIRRTFRIKVTVPLGLGTEAEVEEYERMRRPLPWKLPTRGDEPGAQRADSTSTDGVNHDGAGENVPPPGAPPNGTGDPQ